MRKFYLLLIVALALSVSSVAFAEESGKMHEAMAELKMEDDSGYHGKAHLKDMGDGTTHVKIELEGMSEGMSMPAHIHMGTRDDYDPKPEYPLNNIENGMSETTVEVSLEKLLSEEHVIAVHESEENVGNIVAVGDIEKMMDMPETGAGGMANSQSSTPVTGLALVGLILAAGTLLVRRSRSI